MNYALKRRTKLATFPLAFSYCLGESAESYAFLFKTLNEEVFYNGVEPLGVVMGDQVAGLISAINKHKSMPKLTLQFCNWYAA